MDKRQKKLFWFDMTYLDAKEIQKSLFDQMNWTFKEEYLANTMKKVINLIFPNNKPLFRLSPSENIKIMGENGGIQSNDFIRSIIRCLICYSSLAMLAEEKERLPIEKLFENFKKDPVKYKEYFLSYVVRPIRHYLLFFGQNCADKNIRKFDDVMKDIHAEAQVECLPSFIKDDNIMATTFSSKDIAHFNNCILYKERKSQEKKYTDTNVDTDRCYMRAEITSLMLLLNINKNNNKVRDKEYEEFTKTKNFNSVVNLLKPFLGEPK